MQAHPPTHYLRFATIVFFTTVLFRSFLPVGFWLDETISVWVTSAGIPEVLSRATQYQGQSPLYYVALWSWQGAFGSTELALRSFSLMLLAVTFLCFFRLVRYLTTAQIAWWSTFLLGTLDPVILVLSARPYALALLFAVLSWTCLFRLVERPTVRAAATYAVVTALLGYAHYLLLLTIFPQILIAGWKGREALRTQAMGLLMAAALLAPTLPQLLSILARGGELSFASVPSLAQFVAMVAPGYFVLYLVMGVSLGFLWTKGGSFRSTREYHPLLKGLGVVWLAVPLLLFLVAILGGPVLVIPRYILWIYPALAIIGGVALSMLHPQRAQSIALAAIFLFATARELAREYQVEEWREAAGYLAKHRNHEREPLLLYSGLVENRGLPNLGDPAQMPYLNAPASVYRVPGVVVPIPESVAAEYTSYWEGVIRPTLKGADGAWILYLAERHVEGELPELLREIVRYLEGKGVSAQVVPGAGQLYLLRVTPLKD